MTSSNILITLDESVVLLGYDLVKRIDDVNNCCLGTRGYAAPELYSGKADFRTDIYAVGALMHYMLTGNNPAEPPYEMKPIVMCNPDLSKGLEYVVDKCLKADLDERYQTCEELLKDLNQLEKLPPKKGFLKDLLK